MELHYPVGTRYILMLMLGFIFTSLSCLIYIYQPSEIITEAVTAFTPTSTFYELWETPPFNIYVRIYVFNVTNSEEYLDGKEKLRFQEVGPYTYREVLYNINGTFNDNGTLTFIPKRKLEFVPELSVGNASVDRYLLPNVPLLGITSSLVDSSMFTNLAVASVSSYLGSQPFVHLTIEEYLMGYDDPLVTLANNIIPNWIDFPRFGILDRIMALDNSTELVTININRTNKNSGNTDVSGKEPLMTYAINKWSGSSGLPWWGYKDGENNETHPQNSKCNTVEGSLMGTIFPPNIKKHQNIRLFRRAFCRPIDILYHSSGHNKEGFETYLFKVDPAFLARKENNTNNSCYCRKQNPDDCPPNGIGDISPCYYGIPIAMSQPHFLNTDLSVSSKIEGMSPDNEKHSLRMTVHPRLGVPLEAHLPIQINLMIPETKYHSKTKPFNNLIIPLFWVDLTLDDIPSSIKFYIRLLYHTLPVVEQVLVYVFAILGVSLIFASSLLAVVTFAKDSDYAGFKVAYRPIPLISLKQNLIKTGYA